MFAKTILLAVLLLFLLSCEKKTVSPTISSTTLITSTLRVTVLKFYLNKGNQQTDSPLSRTNVYIYKLPYDSINTTPADFNGVTDSAGVAVFTGLTQTEYYVLTSNFKFGKMTQYVETPPNAVALAQVDY
jgi:hypothetical protein